MPLMSLLTGKLRPLVVPLEGQGLLLQRQPEWWPLEGGASPLWDLLGSQRCAMSEQQKPDGSAPQLCSPPAVSHGNSGSLLSG